MSAELSPFAVDLTDEQKRLLDQLFEKNWDSFISVTEAPPKRGPEIPKGVANVLYETDADLRRSLDDRIADLEAEFARPASGADLNLSLQDTLRAGFEGVIATAALW